MIDSKDNLELLSGDVNWGRSGPRGCWFGARNFRRGHLTPTDASWLTLAIQQHSVHGAIALPDQDSACTFEGYLVHPLISRLGHWSANYMII